MAYVRGATMSSDGAEQGGGDPPWMVAVVEEGQVSPSGSDLA